MKKITLQIIAVLFAMSSWGQVIYINEDFEATDTSGGSVFLTDNSFTKYNYTADLAGGVENWNNSPTPADKTNSVSVHSASSTSQFQAAKLGGHQALLIRGSANYANANAGFYFTGLDLTGQTTLYFEFEVWGGPLADDSDIEATLQTWSINLNHGNSNTDFDISDAYFAPGANVTNNIAFDITNDDTNPTNQTTFNMITEQWIKISGTIDLTGKPLGSFAAFQIQTDTGGFISGGKRAFAIDNVYVANSPTLSNNSFELNNAVKIYPNPANDILNIKTDENIKIESLSLVDVLGKTVYTGKYTNQIDVKNFAKGIYILKITSEENKILNKKVIIE